MSTQTNFNLDDIINRLPQGAAPVEYTESTTGGRVNKRVQKPSYVDNYVLLPKEEWNSLEDCAYIKYHDLDGKYKAKGKFKGFTVISGNNAYINMSKYNSNTRSYFTWQADLSNIGSIYVYKADAKTKKGGSVEEPTEPVREEKKPRVQENITQEQHVINQLGNKLLFDDSDVLKQKIESLSIQVQKNSDDVQKLFLLVKRLYQLLDAKK